MSASNKSPVLMWTGFIAFLAAGLLGSYLLYKNDFLLVFIEWVQSHGAVGVIAFAFVYVIVSVLLLAPAELVSVAAGLVFGLWGVPLVIVSATIAAVLALLISRFLLRNKVERLIAHRPLFQAIDAAVADQSWRIAVLLRLNLLIPFNFQNYFFGITEIGIVPYTVTTFFGIMPLTAMYVYFGMFGHAVTVDQGSGWAKIAFLSLGLVPTVLIIYLVSRKARAELHQIARTK